MKNKQSISIGRMRLMVSLLFCMIILLPGQEPKKKKPRKHEPVSAVSDTTIVNERKADSIYLKQSVHMEKLDSIINEKQKK